MAGYIRQDTTNNIADGNVINASDFDNEYNAIEAAFHASTGHTHDGTSAEGAPITKIGPVQDVVVSITAVTPKTDNTVDLGSSILEFKDLWIDGTANIDSLVADTADINGGTIDGVAIGGSSAAAATFTTVAATTGNITTVNATTVDTTNLEVTNIKAKDGTASMTLADATGVATFSANPILNAGTANGVLYLNASKVATSGTALVFDGTNFATTGSATATAFIPSGSSVPTNGMYLPAANTVAWSTNTTERARLDSSGSLLIATTTNPITGAFPRPPLSIKQINDTSFASGIQLEASADTSVLGIGYSSALSAFVIGTSYRSTGAFRPLAISQSGSEVARFTTTGDLLIGTTSAVSGSMLVVGTGDATIYGVRVGRGAGAVSSNTAVGASALAANTGGSVNAAFGSNALKTNTIGLANAAFGADGLLFNTSGSYNTSVGGGSMYGNSTGSNNTAVGYLALYVTTTASNNTAVGYLSAAAITTGAKNTILGSYSGNQDSLDIRTASNNIVLSDGDGNARQYYDGTSNFWAWRNGGSERMRLDSSGNLGIGTSSPTARLHVDGGVINVQGGTSASTTGASINLVAQNGAAFFAGGAVNITAGSATSGNSNGGNIILTPGSKTASGIPGYVGIGTASPTSYVHVNDDTGLRSGNYTSALIEAKATSAGNTNGVKRGLEIQSTGSWAGTGATNTGLYVNVSAGAGTQNIPAAFIGGNVGFEVAVPSYLLSLGGNSARTVGMERHTTADTAGNNLTLLAGGATSAATDKNGGNLVLSSGTATGSGSSIITFLTTTAGSAGTADRSPTEKMRLDGSGNLGLGRTPTYQLDVNSTARFNSTVGVGNAAPSGSGAGITFPATQSASSDANTLDDYEEGTWTPVIRGSGTAGTYELATANGKYTKIGNTVTVTCNVNFAAAVTGGGTGSLQITGFPFAQVANDAYALTVFASGIDMSAGYTWMTSLPNTAAATTVWYLAQSGDNVAETALPIANVDANDYFTVTGTYRT